MVKKVGVVIGSLSSGSVNRVFADSLMKLEPFKDVIFVPIDAKLPLYSQDYDHSFPEAAKELKETLASIDGLLFVTPEYNQSMTAVSKNVLDWGSRPWGNNSFKGLPAFVASISPSPDAGVHGLKELKHVLTYLGAEIVSEVNLQLKEELYNNEGLIADAALMKQLQDSAFAFVSVL